MARRKPDIPSGVDPWRILIRDKRNHWGDRGDWRVARRHYLYEDDELRPTSEMLQKHGFETLVVKHSAVETALMLLNEGTDG